MREPSSIDVQSVFDSTQNPLQCVQCTRFFRGHYVQVEIDGYPGALCSNKCIEKWYAPERTRNWEKRPLPLPVLPS